MMFKSTLSQNLLPTHTVLDFNATAMAAKNHNKEKDKKPPRRENEDSSADISNIPLPHNIDRCLHNLYARAIAHQQWSQPVFDDPAADLLVDKLDAQTAIDVMREEYKKPELIERCVWIDQQALAFFQQYPEGMGINIGGGINTRFQRLSRQLDWPRFNWVDIENPHLVAINSTLFPETENFTLVDTNTLDKSWLYSSGWDPQRPLLIILEQLPKNHLKGLIQQLKNIEAQIPSGATIYILCDHIHIERHHLEKIFGQDTHQKYHATIRDNSTAVEVAEAIEDLTHFKVTLSAKKDNKLQHRFPLLIRKLFSLTHKQKTWRGLTLSIGHTTELKAQARAAKYQLRA